MPRSGAHNCDGVTAVRVAISSCKVDSGDWPAIKLFFRYGDDGQLSDMMRLPDGNTDGPERSMPGPGTIITAAIVRRV